MPPEKVPGPRRSPDEEYPIKPAAGGRAQREVEVPVARTPGQQTAQPRKPAAPQSATPRPAKPAGPARVQPVGAPKTPAKRPAAPPPREAAYPTGRRELPDAETTEIQEEDAMAAAQSLGYQAAPTPVKSRPAPQSRQPQHPPAKRQTRENFDYEEETYGYEEEEEYSAPAPMRSRQAPPAGSPPAPMRGRQQAPASMQPVKKPAAPAGSPAPPPPPPVAARTGLPMKRPPKIDPAEEALRKKAAPYEWGKTERFSADQKKFLDRLFKQFAENVTTRLAPLLQTRVSMEYQNARLRPYSVFIQSLYEPITLITIRMDPETRGLLVLDFPLSFALIDRCLGGSGQPLEEIRYFTEIETAVLERVVSRLMDGYQEAWTEIKECKPQYQQMDFNPQTVHIAKPSDTMVCVSFDIHMGQSSGPVYVVIPFEYLKAVIPKGSFEEFMLTRTSPPQTGPSIAPLFAKNLDAATVPLAVELGSTELSFGDLLVLEEGDFIKLDQSITEPLRIKVNERTKFLGRPGLRERKVSVQITKVLQEGDDNFDE